MNFIVRTIVNRPVRVMLSFCLLLIVAVLMTGMLHFEQDIFKVFPRKNPIFKILVHALKTSSANDRLYMVVRGPGDPERLIEAGKDLIEKMRKIRINKKPGFKQVTMLKTEAVSARDYEDLLKFYLTRPETFLTGSDIPRMSALLTSHEALERELRRSLALIATPGTSGLSGIVTLDPLNVRRFMTEKLQSMHQGLSFAPGPYLLSTDRRSLLIIATPAIAVQNRSPARTLFNELKSLCSSNIHLKVGITGGYAIAAQEEALVRGDLLSCLAGSVIGIAILFLLIYRNLRVLVFVLLPLGVGIQLSLGLMSLIFNHIHMLAMAFATVVLGLGIDFAIHIYDRYTMERQAGIEVDQATKRSVLRTGSAVLVGGITTLTAFLVLTIADSPLLFQIGWLVALGLMFCLITILWALPAGLVWLERFPRGKIKKSMRLLGMDKLGQLVNKRPVVVLLLSSLLLAAALPGLFRIKIENDASALRPKGLEALEVQEELLEAFGANQEYVLMAWSAKDIPGLWTKGHDLDRVLAGFKQDGIIKSWTSLSKIASHGPLHVQGIDLTAIRRLFKRYGLELKDFEYAHLFLKALSGGDRRTGPVMENSIPDKGHPSAYKALDQLPDILGRFYICEKDKIYGIAWTQVSGAKEVLMLKDELPGTFPGIIIVNPRLAVNEIVKEVRSKVWITVGSAGLLVLGILSIFLRRIASVIFVLMPMTMGLITTAGIMGWAGININLFNFIVLPILIGIGLDDGIHIFRRHKELGDVGKTLATTGRSVFVTTLTTMLGFGSLSLAKYHVLESMGIMTIVGVFACFLFSVLTLPAILRLKDLSKIRQTRQHVSFL